jgi:hypothetical protein
MSITFPQTVTSASTTNFSPPTSCKKKSIEHPTGIPSPISQSTPASPTPPTNQSLSSAIGSRTAPTCRPVKSKAPPDRGIHPGFHSFIPTDRGIHPGFHSFIPPDRGIHSGFHSFIHPHLLPSPQSPISDLQSLISHPPPSTPHQPIQRTFHPQPVFPHRHVQVNLRRRDVFMSQQILDRPQVRSVLQ